MSTRIIARKQGICESNLAKAIKEEGCRTLGDYHYALISRISDGTDSPVILNCFLMKQGTSFQEVRTEYDVNLPIDKKDYVFVSPSLSAMRIDLCSPFLSRRDLVKKGIEPIALYKVKKDYKEIEEVRAYAHHRIRAVV